MDYHSQIEFRIRHSEILFVLVLEHGYNVLLLQIDKDHL